ncbi:MAG TPA: type II toxin-antitoxin system VapC family toxin [Longimicrobiales bacterium]|nr:type II toxin-antitoxin system VapC family toxin [Longimicrobiales bacterium]
MVGVRPDPTRLPSVAAEAVQASLTEGDPLQVSAISAWEVAMLVERGRLELTLDVEEWIGRSHAAPELDFVPVDPWIAVRSVRLGGFPHRDPADRIIVATALTHDATLVTADARLQGYDAVTTLWG